MIRLDTWSDLLTTPGPYATAYLDASRAKELGPQEVAGRWRALRSALSSQGADDATLDAMEAAVGGHTDVTGEHGQLLVASGGTLHLDGVLPGPPRREIAHYGPLPHLMPLAAQLAPLVPHVLVLVDRVGADVTVHGPAGKTETTVEGDSSEVHKVSVGGWAQDRYQNRSENLWESNARQVAEVVESGVRRVAAEVVVVAGDVRARGALLNALGEHARSLVVQIEHGGRAEGGDEAKLTAAVEEAVARVAAERDKAVTDRYAEAAGRAASGVGDVLAVSGLAGTVAALRQAQVETLLVVDDAASDATAWIGPEPIHLALTETELIELGVREPVQDRLDAALVRAAAGTDATIVTLAPGQLDLADGLGATLRYPVVK
ncbi:MAG TPA: Vms1/Ankzf1 family peptidyl-tRNA hydrolase [Mycobacteriales bacterium]|nr:Vms1/Ankzf1 family peptidyl-tRNA hydrolase [Mycobacteriales bacterium]